MADDLCCVYDLRDQERLIAQMQETSLSPRQDAGLAPDPLVGSDAWWSAIEGGEMARQVSEGVITRVYWGSMADWPEFELRDATGDLASWTREGNPRRYVEGLRARVEFVEHPWKNEHTGLGTHSQIKLGVWVERSDGRSSGIAPGPGGAGFEMARRHGEAVHYLAFGSRADAEGAAAALEGVGRTAGVWGGGTHDQWFVDAWSRTADAGGEEIAELRRLAEQFAGNYDGGEVVEGAIWGPGGR